MFYLGLFLFFGIHLIPFNSKLKEILKGKLGEGPYMGLFSFTSLTGILLIVFGYESNSNFLYSINGTALFYSKYIMFLSLTFIVASTLPTYIKKIIRHPMSLGIAIWSSFHLLTNPDMSSVILFSSFLIYSILSLIIAELRNSGIKESSPKIILDVLTILLGVILTFFSYNFHWYLSGVNLN